MKVSNQIAALAGAVLLTVLPLAVNARWIAVDPHANKYPSMSPYVYGNNNPLKFIDPNGQDSYLFTWAPAGGQVGHSAIGTDIRNAQGNQTGQIQVREQWPTSTIDKDHTTAPADYMKSDPINVSDIGAFQSLEGRAADAIVKIGGGAEQDATVNAALDKAATNPTYDAKSNNCTNFTQAGVQATGINPGNGATIQVTIYGMTFTVANNVATPVSLNNTVVGSQDKRVTVVRELPANQQNPNLIVKQR